MRPHHLNKSTRALLWGASDTALAFEDLSISPPWLVLRFNYLHLFCVHTTALHLELRQSTVDLFEVSGG
jgi:hypothetical protein